MGEANYIQASFLGGEWSPFMQGRVDRPDYRSAMNVCLNGYPIETGSWVRRQGTLHCGSTRLGVFANLLTFEFAKRFPYTFEFTPDVMRVWAGSALAFTNFVNPVVSISSATPALVTTSLAHGMTTGQSVLIDGLGTNNWGQLFNRIFLVTVVSPTTFTIADSITSAPFNGSTLGSPPTSPVVRVMQQYTTPYATFAQIDSLRLVNADTSAILLSSTIHPRQVQIVEQPTPTTFASFSISVLDFIDGPYLDANESTLLAGTILPDLVTQVFVIQGPYPDARGTGLVTADIGRYVRVYSTPPPYNAATNYTKNTLVTATDGSFWSYIPAGPALAPAPGTDATAWLPVAPSQASCWHMLTITAISDPVTFFGVFSGPPNQPLYRVSGTVYTKWRLGLYSNTFGWPTFGCYHEGRLWLGGVIPNRIDSSVAGQKFLFSPTESDGTVTDANAISATFAANDINPIFWMLSHPQGLLCGSQGGEWLVRASTADLPLTPTSVQARRVTKIGCADIEPAEAGATVVFVQRYGRKVMEYFPDVFSGRLAAPNLTDTAKHLTTSGVLQIAYQRELAPILWARMADGSLKGVTYKRENLNSAQGPQFAGWHRHVLGSGRVIARICQSGSRNGDLDTLMMVTFDAATGTHHVEMLTDMFDESKALTGAWFLDNAFLSTSYTEDDTALTVYGFHYLEGKNVSAWIGGLDCGDYTVSGGKIVVPWGNGVDPDGTARGLLTPAYFASLEFKAALVGFTYTSQGQLLRPNAPAETGARIGPAFGKTRRHEWFAIQLVTAVSGSIRIGTNFTAMHPIVFRTGGGTQLTILQTFSGVHRDTIADEYSTDGRLSWQITRPYPCVLTAIGGFIKTQDV